MTELTEIVYKGLTGNQSVFDLFGNKVFPLMADEETEYPFITYDISQFGKSTKEGFASYELIVRNYDVDYDKVLRKAKVVNDALIALSYLDKTYRFKEVRKKPLVTEDYKVFVEQVYEIKI